MHVVDEEARRARQSAFELSAREELGVEIVEAGPERATIDALRIEQRRLAALDQRGEERIVHAALAIHLAHAAHVLRAEWRPVLVLAERVEQAAALDGVCRAQVSARLAQPRGGALVQAVEELEALLAAAARSVAQRSRREMPLQAVQWATGTGHFGEHARHEQLVFLGAC